jgi:hypothetical protein
LLIIFSCITATYFHMFRWFYWGLKRIFFYRSSRYMCRNIGKWNPIRNLSKLFQRGRECFQCSILDLNDTRSLAIKSFICCAIVPTLEATWSYWMIKMMCASPILCMIERIAANCSGLLVTFHWIFSGKTLIRVVSKTFSL